MDVSAAERGWKGWTQDRRGREVAGGEGQGAGHESG